MKKPPAKTPSSSQASTTRRNKSVRKENRRSSKRRMSKADERVDDRQEELKKGPWTADEDELLVRYIKTHGEGGWRTLPKRAGLLRCGKSCRLRWMNYLRPNVKRGHITPDEEDLILRLHRLLGNRYLTFSLSLSLLILFFLPNFLVRSIMQIWIPPSLSSS